MRRTPATSDPDHTVARRVARKVGLRVALLSSIMVVAGVLLLFSYLWVDDQQRGPGKPHGIGQEDRRGHGLDVKLDVEDLARIVPVVGVAVIVLAGGGAMLFARQAIKPLQDMMRRQRDFIGDASHELRTPLAVLDARVQHAQILAGDDARLGPVLEELRGDSRALTGIINDLLATVSDADAEFEPAPLAEALCQVHDEMSLLAAEHGIALRVSGAAELDPALMIAVPEAALRRCILALVDNAIGHTKVGQPVTIEAAVSGRWAIVRVIDAGHGITGIDPGRIFERFARGRQAEGTPERDSHGIGLALVHDVATRYGGSVGVERTGPDGTVMRLRLPVAKKGVQQ